MDDVGLDLFEEKRLEGFYVLGYIFVSHFHFPKARSGSIRALLLLLLLLMRIEDGSEQQLVNKEIELKEEGMRKRALLQCILEGCGDNPSSERSSGSERAEKSPAFEGSSPSPSSSRSLARKRERVCGLCSVIVRPLHVQ